MRSEAVRLRPVLVGSLLLVAGTTLALALVPTLDYAYRSPGLQIALHTADAVIALVVAYLVYGRYRVSRRTRDLLLTTSLAVLALANLPLSGVLDAHVDGHDHLQAWASLAVRLLGAGLFAAAALVGESRRTDPRDARRAAVAGATLLAWLTVTALLATGDLPAPVPPTDALDTSRPWVTGHAAVLAVQAMGLLLYAVAAWAFARAAVREEDEFLTWLAGAAVLSAGARLNYLAFPSLYTDHVYTGDLLRGGFYLLLLVGAAREIRTYWVSRVPAAVARGRTDLARELGDSLLPALQAAADTAPEDAPLRRLQSTTAELLDRARQDVAPLLAREPFEAALRAALVPLVARSGLALAVRADGRVAAAQHDQVLSLAVAATEVTAAAGARAVRISLSDSPRRLVVVGTGAPAPMPPDFWSEHLQSLRAVAAAAGGELSVVALDGDSSAITVDLLEPGPRPPERPRGGAGPGTAHR